MIRRTYIRPRTHPLHAARHQQGGPCAMPHTRYEFRVAYENRHTSFIGRFYFFNWIIKKNIRSLRVGRFTGIQQQVTSSPTKKQNSYIHHTTTCVYTRYIPRGGGKRGRQQSTTKEVGRGGKTVVVYIFDFAGPSYAFAVAF